MGHAGVRGSARLWSFRIWEGDVCGFAWFADGRLNQGTLCLLVARGLSNVPLKPNKVELIGEGLKGIPDALQRLADGKVSGVKVVARPGETPAA